MLSPFRGLTERVHVYVKFVFQVQPPITVIKIPPTEAISAASLIVNITTTFQWIGVAQTIIILFQS